MCSEWISKQTAIISLYSINWLVFITELDSVYCAVRDECLNTFPVSFCLQVLLWVQLQTVQLTANCGLCTNVYLFAAVFAYCLSDFLCEIPANIWNRQTRTASSYSVVQCAIKTLHYVSLLQPLNAFTHPFHLDNITFRFIFLPW
jgi:hypothetical protein